MEQLKKYKLKDLVTNGSYARRKVNSDLLVGDTSAGYGYGDILDANATAQLVGEMFVDLNIDDINQLAALSSSKADKVVSATENDFAGLDANGNLMDSGSKTSDFATAAQGAKADSAVQDARYVHTDNNYTTAEKNKLAAITASVTGNTLTITTIVA